MVAMPRLMNPPPYSQIETVTEMLHGVSVADPYRWLEDQELPRTRQWLAAQTWYARSYLDSIPDETVSDIAFVNCSTLKRMTRFKELGIVTSLESVCRGKNNPAYAYAKVGMDQIKCWSIQPSGARGRTQQ